MTQFLIIFLLTLLVATGFFAYIFNHFRNQPLREGPIDQMGAEEEEDLQNLAHSLQKGNADNAQLVLAKLTNRRLHEDEIIDVLALRVRAFFALKEFQSALHYISQLSKQRHYSRFLGEIELMEHLGAIYAAIRQHEKSYNEYMILSRKCPENMEYLFFAASQALEFKQYDIAVSLLNRVLEINPDHLACQVKLGRIFYERKLYSKALEHLNQAYSSNLDSDELRYYLALTLIQTRGKDNMAIALLERVAQNPAWAERALPRLAKFSARLGSHERVIKAVSEYRSLAGRGKDESLQNQLTMLQANAYRSLQQIEKACRQWLKIPSSSIYHKEAQNHYASLQIFTEQGIFQDYIHAEPQEFVQFCTKICEHNLKARNPDIVFELRGRVLKTALTEAANGEGNTGLYPEEAGAIILQSFQGQWNSSTGRLSKRAPVCHIFLYLDQQFNNLDLQANLQEMGVDQSYGESLNIHIYGFHYIPESSYSQNPDYSVYVHQANELKLDLLEYKHHLDEKEAEKT